MGVRIYLEFNNTEVAMLFGLFPLSFKFSMTVSTSTGLIGEI